MVRRNHGYKDVVWKQKSEKTFLIAKISRKKNLIVALDFVAVANL